MLISYNFKQYLNNSLQAIIDAPSCQNAKEIYVQVEQYAKTNNFVIPNAYDLFFSGYIHYRQGHFGRALKAHISALDKAKQQQHTTLEHYLQFIIGLALYRIGDSSKAIASLSNAASCKDHNQSNLLSRVYNTFGMIFLDAADYEQACSYFSMAYQEIQHQECISYTPVVTNLAYLQAIIGNMDKSAQLFKRFRQNLESYPNQLGQLFYCSAYASYLELKQDYSSALIYFFKTIKCAEEIGDNVHMLSAIEEYCLCLLDHFPTRALEPYLSHGISLAKHLGSTSNIQHFANILFRQSELVGTEQYKYQLIKRAYELQTLSIEIHAKKDKSYLSQLYQLNADRVKLETAQSIESNLELIASIGEYIASYKSMDNLIMRLYNDLSLVMPISYLALGTYNQEQKNLDYSHYVVNGRQLEPFTVDCNEIKTLSSYCIHHRESVTHGQFSNLIFEQLLGQHPSHVAYATNKEESRPEEYPSIIMLPLILDGVVLGVMTVQSQKELAYRDYHISLFKHLSSYLAVGLQNKAQQQLLLQQQQELENLVLIDPLSCLLNRKSLLESISEQSGALSGSQRLGILLVDIDYYKQYNDQYGHLQGDDVLVTLANLLNSHFYESNHKVFRYGGDEFLILLTCNSSDTIQQLTYSLQERVEQLNIAHANSYCSDRVSFSIGGAIFDNNSLQNKSAHSLIQTADDALYKVKARGRAHIHIEDTTQSQICVSLT